MSGKTFVDTNILIYAYDLDSGAKHTVAADRLRLLWRDGAGVLSTQVLQEFYVNVTGKTRETRITRRGSRGDQSLPCLADRGEA